MSGFGNMPSGSSSQGSGGLFGGNNATTGATSDAKQNIFGGLASKPPVGGGIFGGNGQTGTSTGGAFGGSSGGSTPTTGGLFGGGGSTSNTATAATAAPSSNSLFGGGFNLSKASDQSTASTEKPAGSSFFSQPATSNTASTTPTGGLFGPPKPADSTAAPVAGSAAATSGGLFGGSIFGKTTTPSATAAAPSSTFSLGGTKDAATPAAASSGLFSSTGGATKPADKKDTAPAATPAPATFNLFGGPKPDEKKSTTTAPATSSLGQAPSNDNLKPTDTQALATPTAPAANSAVSAVAVPPPSMLRGKTIEEIVNRWSGELETHVREFSKFAGDVAVWDRALIENGNNLAALYSHVLAAEREQNDIDQSLDHIEQQQRDLTSTLQAYEKVTQEVLGSQGGSLRALDTGPADTERDKNYMLATDLHTHLDDLSGSLTQMIDSVNALSLPSNDSGSGEDPMAQIAQILSSHLESLQWIDGAVNEVESKVSEVEKRVKESGHHNSNGVGLKNRGFGHNR